MLVTGPIGVTANTPITLEDPSRSSGSVAVQIQNGSSFSLSVSTLGRVFEIGANSAVTIPAYNGTPVTITPGAAGASGNALIAVWLFPGEFNPQHDGAIPAITQQGPTTVGEIVGTDFYATGLPGATVGARFVGGTTSGPPATGTFTTNDMDVDSTGGLWLCTAGGSPGTWVPAGAQHAHARVYRNAAWSSGVASNVSMDAASFDVMGSYTGLVYNCPFRGYYSIRGQLGITATAAGQFAYAQVYKNGVLQSQRATYATGAGNFYAAIVDSALCNPGDTLVIGENCTVGLAGLTGPVQTFATFDLIGGP